MSIMFKIMKIVLNQRTIVFTAVYPNSDLKVDKIEKNAFINALRMVMMDQPLLSFLDNLI